jgi:hypothetical protein
MLSPIYIYYIYIYIYISFSNFSWNWNSSFEVVWSGGEYNVMVIDVFGPRLKDLFNCRNIKFLS